MYKTIRLEMATYDYLFKFIVIGDTGTGKSCITQRFVEDKFNLVHDLTIGVEFGARTIKANDKDIKIQIWDTAGQESFRSITRSYYRGCAGALLVYDVTRRETFRHLDTWMHEVKEHAGNHTKLILIGNKTDLDDTVTRARRQVTTEEGKAFADKHNIMFIETSAKTGDNVRKAFHQVTEELLGMIERKEIRIDSSTGIKIGGQQVKRPTTTTSKTPCCTIM